MGRLGTFFIGFFLGGATIYLSLHFHIVRANDGIHSISKVYPKFSETYVDIREFGFADWEDHPGLAAAIVQAEKVELLGDAAVQPLRDTVNGFLSTFDSN